MKDLEARTGVTREAIHFYLREGLLPEPHKPKRNVALYSEDHVVRLQVIKHLQAERHLPLKKIKAMLDKADFGAVTPGDDLASFESLFLSLVDGDLPAGDHHIEKVAAETGIPEADIKVLASAGVVSIKDERVDFRDAAILEQWGQFQELGFREVSGFGPEFILRYAQIIDEIAEREVDHFLAGFQHMPTDQAAELAANGIEIANDLLTRLHTRSLAKFLRARVAAQP